MQAKTKRDATGTKSIPAMLTGMASALALFAATPALAWTEAEIDGIAHTFKKGCDATEYPVRGRYHVMHGMSHFTLEGAAPIRSGTGCDISGHSMTGGNARLKFDIAWD